MELHIISPEQVLYKGIVDSVTLPGKDGEFQILNMHAPIVSSLTAGTVKIKSNEKAEETAAFIERIGDDWMLAIKGGVIELNNNKIIVLTD